MRRRLRGELLLEFAHSAVRSAHHLGGRVPRLHRSSRTHRVELRAERLERSGARAPVTSRNTELGAQRVVLAVLRRERGGERGAVRRSAALRLRVERRRPRHNRALPQRVDLVAHRARVRRALLREIC